MPNPSILTANEQDEYEEELKRQEALCKRAQDEGMTVPTGELRPAPLHSNGTEVDGEG